MPAGKKIIPTVLEHSKSSTEKFVKKISKELKELHLDVIDESYGKPTYFSQEIIAKHKPSVVHVMVNTPFQFIIDQDLSKNTRYLIHNRKIKKIVEFGEFLDKKYEFGVYFDLRDDFVVKQEILENAKEFMFMPVLAGASGQKPDLKFLNNIETFLSKYSNFLKKSTIISTDGGFSDKTIKTFLKTPANVYYANSYFKKYGVKEAIKYFSKHVQTYKRANA